MSKRSVTPQQKTHQIQESQKDPNTMSPKRPTPRHIIIKMSKVNSKERILNAAIEKQLLHIREPP